MNEDIPRVDVLVIEVDRIKRILNRLVLEFPNVDPNLFEYLKQDLGVK